MLLKIYVGSGNQPALKPISANMKPMMSQIMIGNITATMFIANALSQPQSKKCLTKANQIISSIKYAISEPISEPKTSGKKFVMAQFMN
jgi:hypothetical protein